VMVKRDQFYLTLPSNSSMDYYPQNTTANYITHLASTVDLTNGEWEIALVEAHYPCTFETVSENDAQIFVYTSHPIADKEASAASRKRRSADAAAFLTTFVGPKDKVVSVETMQLAPGNYKTIFELISALNKLPFMNDYAMFKYEARSDKVEIATDETVMQIVLSPGLAIMLGFDPTETDLKTNNRSVRPVDILATVPAHMYVYCDLVEPQMVGDTLAPLLKIVNMDTIAYKYGAHKQVHFNDPHYLPLVKGAFESVEVDLRDIKGDRLRFQFGASCMKLHLRRVTR